jgi:hypothetical protein
MKQGLFFIGSIEHQDCLDASNAIFQQFDNICEYQNKLLELFTNVDIKPFDLILNVFVRKLSEEKKR